MRVIWSPKAIDQILAIYNYIAQFNPEAAQRVMLDIHTQGSKLATFPHRGRKVAGTDLRESTLVHPYIIRYEVVQNEVHILRVRHSSRKD